MKKYMDIHFPQAEPSGHRFFILFYHRAATNGHLEVLQWAYQNKFKYVDINACAYLAAEHGHMNVLEWAIQNGFIVNHLVFKKAILNNQIDIYEWLQVNYYGYDTDNNNDVDGERDFSENHNYPPNNNHQDNNNLTCCLSLDSAFLICVLTLFIITVVLLFLWTTGII
jgi:hypothetical protein